AVPVEAVERAREGAVGFPGQRDGQAELLDAGAEGTEPTAFDPFPDLAAGPGVARVTRRGDGERAEQGGDGEGSCRGSHGVALSLHLVSGSSGWKISSMGLPNSRAILKASGRLGSYLPVSIAVTVWRDTSRRSARSPWDQSRSARSTFRRFFIGSA